MFAAGNYVIFGRLLHLGALLYPGKRLTWLPTKNVVAVFVTRYNLVSNPAYFSDVISFLVQVGGAIVLLGQNASTERQKTGQNTLMAGLAINLASFCLFFTLIMWYEVATRRVVKRAKRSYAPIIYASMVSQFFLIGRSIYRVIEFQQGYFSSIATTEIYFYMFDTMLMIFATSIYIAFFPPAFGLLGKKRVEARFAAEASNVEMSRANQSQIGGSTNEADETSLTPTSAVKEIARVHAEHV
jgi:RTA1 like protein